MSSSPPAEPSFGMPEPWSLIFELVELGQAGMMGRLGVRVHLTCSLTGTKDIIGRLINGVPEDRVCTGFTTVEGATGAFVQIEEDTEARKTLTDAWPTWVSAF